MLQALVNVFKIADLRTRVLFTIGMLVIYRIGFWIPLPGVNQEKLSSYMQQEGNEGLQNLAQFVSMFTGGSLGKSTLFGLGILPYISAAIIFQLLATTLDSLKQLQKEGPAGQQKIQEYTRYATLGLCLIQSTFYLNFFQSQNLVFPGYEGSVMFWTIGVLGMTTGTMFLMWLGEQIDKYGIGNGASLIITAGIVSSMPGALGWVIDHFTLEMTGGGTDSMTPLKVILLLAAFVFVVAGTVLITRGQRRIPVQQAKHTRGRRVYGGQRHYLPLRVNHGGVMPIIFASSLMMFPSIILPWITNATANSGPWLSWVASVSAFLSDELRMGGGYLHLLVYIAMIYFFAYFWTSVQFQPKEMSEQLRDHGSFIPGLRPGPRTANYLERVMERITYVGAGFLAAIAVIPTLVQDAFGIPFSVSSFLGGTGLLITVSVALDFVDRIEANLLMRNYRGFLSSGAEQGAGAGGGRGPSLTSPTR